MSVPTITGRMEWKGPEVDWKRQMEWEREGERQGYRMDSSEYVITGMDPFLGIEVEWILFW